MVSRRARREPKSVDCSEHVESEVGSSDEGVKVIATEKNAYYPLGPDEAGARLGER
jgi:hypothetical protein